ncbi:hypothetical protein [Shimwellia pseudoproteus]|uniref:hypothetical protein n=1 Tax=Shimwellia pseudoproteus TaxID=570012 RepID=UPI001E3804E4|nr:hypothetical protein [Shimwellia pseudoproteus]
MKVNALDTALVIIDPQIEVLSPKGANWPVLKESVTRNNTVEHLTLLFKAAAEKNIKRLFPLIIFIPPIISGNLMAHWKPQSRKMIVSCVKAL